MTKQNTHNNNFYNNFSLQSSPTWELDYLLRPFSPEREIKESPEYFHQEKQLDIDERLLLTDPFEESFPKGNEYCWDIDRFPLEIQMTPSNCAVYSQRNPEFLFEQPDSFRFPLETEPTPSDYQVEIRKRIIKKNKNPQKNIHRYISRQIIRNLISDNLADRVEKLCVSQKTTRLQVKEYFEENLEKFTNIAILREHWNIEDKSENKEIKKVFFIFSKWYLSKGAAIRYICHEGKMKDKKKYVEYKNKVMLKYAKNPKKFKCNK